MPRPSKQDYYFGVAKNSASRATCLRRRFGAVIVKDDLIVSTGYCGAPRDWPNCIDLGKCVRQEQHVPSGERYELCRSVHAELNAIINGDREKIIGGDMYLYGEEAESGEIFDAYACKMCKRVITNARIKKLYAKTKAGIVEWNVADWAKEKN